MEVHEHNVRQSVGASTDADGSEATKALGDYRRLERELKKTERELIADPDTSSRPEDGEQPRDQEPILAGELATAATTAARVIARARTQRGFHEGPNRDENKFGAWYGWNEVPWCAIFVSWVFHQEGLPLSATTPKGFASCSLGSAWFKRRRRWRNADVRPAPGWVVFFDWNSRSPLDHVGIVIEVLADGRVRTIEGNTSDPFSNSSASVGVFEKNRRSGIIGYGVPEFAVVTPLPDQLPELKRGDRGGAVRRVQGLLRAAKPELTDASLSLGGDFGSVTEGLIKELQTRHRLEPDGVVGPQTWRALLGLHQLRP